MGLSLFMGEGSSFAQPNSISQAQFPLDDSTDKWLITIHMIYNMPLVQTINKTKINNVPVSCAFIHSGAGRSLFDAKNVGSTPGYGACVYYRSHNRMKGLFIKAADSDVAIPVVYHVVSI